MAEFTRDQIAEAALEVADEHGARGFTMRAVAEKLGVTPMALYHYVEDKAALVALLVDAVIAERPLPAPTGSWREDLWAIGALDEGEHARPPGGEPVRRRLPRVDPVIFPMTERWLSIWQQSGLEFEAAVRAALISSTAVIGFVEEELILGETVPPEDSVLSSFPYARLAFAAERDGSEEFELVVRSLIEGLHAAIGST